MLIPKMYGTLISVTLEETFWAVVLLNCSSVNGFHPILYMQSKGNTMK